MSKVCMVIRYPRCPVNPIPFWESVGHQDHPDLEVVVLAEDPGSGSDSFGDLRERFTSRGILLTVIAPEDAGNLTFGSLLETARGEYFSFPDTESLLEPEFASTLSEFLDANPACNAVRCNSIFVDELDPAFPIGRGIDTCLPHAGNILESLVIKETSINACFWMMRRAAMEQSVDAPVCLEPAGWDWQFVLPAAYGGNVGFIDKDLLRMVHHANGPMQEMLTRYDERIEFIGAFFGTCIDVIENLNAPEATKTGLKNLARLSCIKEKLDTDRLFSGSGRWAERRGELAGLVKEYGGDPGSLEHELVVEDGSEAIVGERAAVLRLFFYSCLLIRIFSGKIPCETAHRVMQEGLGVFKAVGFKKRFCVYGAGSAAWDILPFFLALGLRPEYIWDRSASPAQSLLGIPVSPPDFSAIPRHEKENLEVIVAIGHLRPAREVRQLLNTAGFSKVVSIWETHGAISYLQDLICGHVASCCRPFLDQAQERQCHG